MTKKIRKPKDCDCINVCNKQLEELESNTRIVSDQYVDIKTGRTSGPRISIMVEKADPTKRKLPKPVYPTYCPICGRKYTD